MSNYGLHVKTAVPYTLALLLLALYSRRAALLYTGGDARTQRLRYILTSYSWVVLLVLLSSYIYSLNDALKDIHYALGTVLIILVGTASFWMFQLRSPLKRDWLFLIIQLSGDVVALLTSLGDVHLLFLAEILANVGFASFLVRTSRWVPAEEARKSFSRGVGGRS
jgi:hypothetical protein